MGCSRPLENAVLLLASVLFPYDCLFLTDVFIFQAS